MTLSHPPSAASPECPPGPANTPPQADAIEVRSPTSDERSALLSWLGAGLRPGRPGWLERELPVALAPERLEDHVVAFEGDRFLAHALARRVRVHGPHGVTLPIGLIGLVYTDPGARGRGLASRCVEHCVERLAESGATLVALWSELEGFYERLGFEWAGRDALYVMDREVCGRALTAAGDDDGLEIGPASSEEVEAVESLHAARPIGALRARGELGRMRTAPACTTLVARRRGEVVATVSLGRGDDFTDVVHEWAGSADGVLACLERLTATRDAIGMLAGPVDDPALQTLREAGAGVHERPFALVRVTDPAGLWRHLTAASPELAERTLRADGEALVLERREGEPERREMSRCEALDLLFGRGAAGSAAATFTSDERTAVATTLPWPLYLWGFDSI